MLSFYRLDATNIVIIVTVGFISYKLLHSSDQENNNNYLAFGVSFLLGIILSVIFSYLTLENDTILTSNFWE